MSGTIGAAGIEGQLFNCEHPRVHFRVALPPFITR